MSDFLKSRITKILISIIWGLGLAALFNISCKEGQKCKLVEFTGPPQDLLNKVWSYGEPGQCYSVKPKITECDVIS